MIQLNCLEPLTNIACGLAFLDGGVTAAIVGGAGLLTRFRENSEKHSLNDSSRLVGKVQAAIFRACDRYDTTQSDRDALTEADAALTRLLPQIMFSTQELANASVSLADYPRHVAHLFAEILAQHDPIFIAPTSKAPMSPARTFALQIMEAAIVAAMDDTQYAPLLTLRLQVAGNHAHAITHQKLDENLAFTQKQLALTEKQNELLRHILANSEGAATAGGVEEVTVIALARRIAEGDVTTVDEAIIQLSAAIDTYVAMRDRAERRTNENDLVDRTLRAMAARNEQRNFDGAANDGERAYGELLKQEEEHRAAMRAARMTIINNMIDQHRLRNDPAAMAHWIIEGLRAEHGELTADVIVREISENQSTALIKGPLLELEVALALARQALEQYKRDDYDIFLYWRGATAFRLNERIGGAAGKAYFDESITFFEQYLIICTKDKRQIQWAVATDSLASACAIQGERTGGTEGLALLTRCCGL